MVTPFVNIFILFYFFIKIKEDMEAIEFIHPYRIPLLFIIDIYNLTKYFGCNSSTADVTTNAKKVNKNKK